MLEYLNPMEHRSYQERGKENLEFLLAKKTAASEVVPDAAPEQKALLDVYDREIAEFIRTLTGQERA